MNLRLCLLLSRGFLFGMFFWPWCLPMVNAIDARCANATKNGGVKLSTYEIHHFHYEDGESHLFLLSSAGEAVAELRYLSSDDGLSVEVVDYSVDLDHHDPKLERELFAVLRKLKPLALFLTSSRG